MLVHREEGVPTGFDDPGTGRAVGEHGIPGHDLPGHRHLPKECPGRGQLMALPRRPRVGDHGLGRVRVHADEVQAGDPLARHSAHGLAIHGPRLPRRQPGLLQPPAERVRKRRHIQRLEDAMEGGDTGHTSRWQSQGRQQVRIIGDPPPLVLGGRGIGLGKDRPRRAALMPPHARVRLHLCFHQRLVHHAQRLAQQIHVRLPCRRAKQLTQCHARRVGHRARCPCSVS